MANHVEQFRSPQDAAARQAVNQASEKVDRLCHGSKNLYWGVKNNLVQIQVEVRFNGGRQKVIDRWATAGGLAAIQCYLKLGEAVTAAVDPQDIEDLEFIRRSMIPAKVLASLKKAGALDAKGEEDLSTEAREAVIRLFWREAVILCSRYLQCMVDDDPEDTRETLGLIRMSKPYTSLSKGTALGIAERRADISLFEEA